MWYGNLSPHYVLQDTARQRWTHPAVTCEDRQLVEGWYESPET